MTAETDIAAVDDGGANTAAEVRTALTSVLARADIAALISRTLIGDSAATARVEFGSGDVTIYDGDNAKRLEILNGGDIVLYDEDGSTARLTWDETATALVAGADLDMNSNRLLNAEAIIPPWIQALSSDGAGANDDYFDDASLAGAWTELNVSGTYTGTEANGVYSVKMNTAGTANDYNGIIKAVSISTGDIWETCIRLQSDNGSSGYLFAGIVMADGDTATDNLAGIETGRSNTTTVQDQIQGRVGTFTNEVGDGSTFPSINRYGLNYLRVKYTSANTFDVYYSPDGATWYNVRQISKTMTPDHIGLIWNCWTDTPTFRVATFEYIRKVV